MAHITLFDRFGGVRQMAEHLSEPPSTVQSWKTAGRVPAGKQRLVLAKARDLDLPVTAEDVIYPFGYPRDEEEAAAGADAKKNIRIVLCAECDRRMDDPAVASCTDVGCPRAQAEAA